MYEYTYIYMHGYIYIYAWIVKRETISGSCRQASFNIKNNSINEHKIMYLHQWMDQDRTTINHTTTQNQVHHMVVEFD